MTWWIATVAPSLERRAAAALDASGLDRWLPMRRVDVKHRHMKVAEPREYPLFPGYIFARPCACRSDWRHAWHAIRSAEGVRGVLANNGAPLTLTDGTVALLRRRLEAPAIAAIADAYRIGEHVRVTDTGSPFCGLDAEVFGADRGKISVLMAIFGRQTPVEMLSEQLRRVA